MIGPKKNKKTLLDKEWHFWIFFIGPQFGLHIGPKSDLAGWGSRSLAGRVWALGKKPV